MNHAVPIVFLLGWKRSQEDFAALRASFAAQGCKTLIFDFPGMGSAAQPTTAWSVDDYADFTRRALRKEGLNRIIIIAHSFGTRVASVLAATTPELVTGMVLIGAPLIRKLTFKRRGLMLLAILWRAVSWLPGAHAVEVRLNAWLRTRHHSMDFLNVSGVMREVLKNVVRFDLRPYLSKICVPVLLLYGERDMVTPVSVQKRALPFIAHGRLHIVKNAGHMVLLEQPTEVENSITQFIASL